MDKYLLEILKDKTTIIIPGLGALTITDKTTGAIKFMPYLSHDDGALSLYISESEGIERNDSKNLIAKYVREIHAELDKGESYDMYEFGSFFKSGDEIEFRSWRGEQIQKIDPEESKASKENNSPIEDDTKQKITKEQESKKSSVKKSGGKKKSEEQSSEKPSKKSDKTNREKNTKEPTANNDTRIVETQVKAEHKSSSNKEKQKLNIIQKEELSSNEKKLDALKHQSNTNTNKNRKGVGFWMLLLLILLIVAGGTYIGINYDNVKQHIPFLADSPQATDKDKPEKMKQITGENKQTESSTDQIIASESTQVNDTNIDVNEESGKELAEEQAVDTETKEEVTSEAPSSNKNTFHIIAGAFSSESNAKLLGNKLRAKGYEVKVGRGRGRNLVSIKSFATRAEANQALAEFKEEAPNCWIYEWK